MFCVCVKAENVLAYYWPSVCSLPPVATRAAALSNLLTMMTMSQKAEPQQRPMVQRSDGAPVPSVTSQGADSSHQATEVADGLFQRQNIYVQIQIFSVQLQR